MNREKIETTEEELESRTCQRCKRCFSSVSSRNRHIRNRHSDETHTHTEEMNSEKPTSTHEIDTSEGGETSGDTNTRAEDVKGEKNLSVQEIETSKKRTESWSCQECAIDFTSNFSLNRHIRNVHSMLRRRGDFRCKFCSVLFTNHEALTKHISRDHLRSTIFSRTMLSSRMTRSLGSSRRRCTSVLLPSTAPPPPTPTTPPPPPPPLPSSPQKSLPQSQSPLSLTAHPLPILSPPSPLSILPHTLQITTTLSPTSLTFPRLPTNSSSLRDPESVYSSRSVPLLPTLPTLPPLPLAQIPQESLAQRGEGMSDEKISERRRKLAYEDALDTPLSIPHDLALYELILRYWESIKTWLRPQRVVDTLNIRTIGDTINEVTSDDDAPSNDIDSSVWSLLLSLWHETLCRIKLNCSLGCILVHKTTGELRYFHSSLNNATLFDSPRLITTELKLRKFYESLASLDLRELSVRQRPNTAWRLRMITNITIYSYKMLGMGKVGGLEIDQDESVKNVTTLPDYLLRNRSILTLHKSTRGIPYKDKLCFFRCLAVRLKCECGGRVCKCRGAHEKYAKQLLLNFLTWRGHTIETDTIGKFEGVDSKDLLVLEEFFKIQIVVLKLLTDGNTSSIVWASRIKRENGMIYLNLFNNHFSLIKDVSNFARAHTCEVCEVSYTRYHSLSRHNCKADKASVFVFPGGEFGVPPTIFTKLKQLAGIDVTDPNLLYFPFRMTFDIESMLLKDGLPEKTSTIRYESRHELVSVSVCSNVPGYTQPVCFVRDGNVLECVNRMVAYMLEVSDASGEIVRGRFAGIVNRLTRLIENNDKKESLFSNEKFSNKGGYTARTSLYGLQRELDHYISAVPVVGFNSQKYDINVIKAELIQCLIDLEDEELSFVVKKLNSMTCVESTRLRFLDVCNFIAPGFNYDKYLRAFNCSQQKGFFPYEWMDCLEKLDFPSLPPAESFHSSLRNTEITTEDYAYCQKIWIDKGMTKFRDFLVWYNNLDVEPFIEALHKQSEVYKLRRIDMLKSAISLPGLAVRWLFDVIERSQIPTIQRGQSAMCPVADFHSNLMNRQPICLIDRFNSDMYHLIRGNLVGGPSIVFSRYHEANETLLRPLEFGDSSKVCKSVLGVDANALYLYCMGMDMPTGYPKRRYESEGFETRKSGHISKTALGWLTYESWRLGTRIRHQLDGGEVRLGRHGLPVDGYCADTSTVFQFHGCFWHGHKCSRTRGVEVNSVRKVSMVDLYKDTMKKEEYLRHLGYTIRRVWECEWENQVSNDRSIRKFLNEYFKAIHPKGSVGDLSEIVESIRSGKFFGLVECDISVPDNLYEKFSEMAPIFKNANVGREHAGEHMREFAERNCVLPRPQRMLVGSLFGKKILLLSKLAKWYLEQGLVITRVYQLVEYIPRRVYESFTESVSQARRAGDADPSLSLLADTSKLIGNSAYGKTITNKEKHRNVKYTEGSERASVKIRGNNFVSLNELSDDFYEIELRKSRTNIDVPLIVGFCILQYAKLRMLEFYYGFMDKFVDRKDFQYVEMDTDSAYMALSDVSLEKVIRPEMRKTFYREYGAWFPRPYCENHKSEFLSVSDDGEKWNGDRACCIDARKHDTRTPGLFKEEFSGVGIIALNPKTYFCWNAGDLSKHSSKGLSKWTNQLTRESYLGVLKSGVSVQGENKGFVKKDNVLHTYSQIKTGLTYQYYKREVLSDGVSTKNTTV